MTYRATEIIMWTDTTKPRPIAALLLDGFERYEFTEPSNDLCLHCGSTNTSRWRLRKLTYFGWTYKNAIECHDCIYEDYTDAKRKTKKKPTPRASANMTKFKQLTREQQAAILNQLL